MTQYPITVITVTYSPGAHLAAFLDSLGAATSRPVNVVVVDNGSTDGAPEAAAASDERVTLLRSGGNIGYGAAMNLGVRAAPDAEYLLLSNPDIVFGPGSIDRLIAAGEANPSAGALGPLILEPNGDTYPSAREQPRLVMGGIHALVGVIWPGNPWTRRYHHLDANPVERTAGWLSGACLLVRRDVFESIGGFDEGYFMFLEDVDLGDRITKAGWENRYVPAAVATHAKSHAVAKNPVTMIPAHHASAFKFQADRHPARWQAPLRWALRAGLWLRLRLVVAVAARKRHVAETTPASETARVRASTGVSTSADRSTDEGKK